MLTMEEFQNRGVHKYDQVVKQLKALGKAPSFDTYDMYADVGLPDADCVVLVVAPAVGSPQNSPEDSQSHVKELASLIGSSKLIVLVNKL